MDCLLDRDVDLKVKNEVLNELSNLFIPECATNNWTTLVDGLTQFMLGADVNLQEKTAVIIGKING